MPSQQRQRLKRKRRTRDKALKKGRDAYYVAVDLLSRREHAQLELETKLKKKGFAEQAIADAMVLLHERDLQSDQRYLEDFVRSRMLKGYGPMRISHDCRQRGVNESLYHQYMDSEDFDWLALAQATYAKKYKENHEIDRPEKAKRVRFMQSKGYPSDIIFQLFD